MKSRKKKYYIYIDAKLWDDFKTNEENCTSKVLALELGVF